ncbi:MAG: RpiB/LacA/LacB family sugar-phosphate isomerase, partial [bacterium]|nr:RpiB/LacA/LacB family sugar-phosphate isomerase [bacterium]
MKLYIGTDHRGFALKNELVPWLTEQGHQVLDLSAPSMQPDDDYPPIAFAVAQAVAEDMGGRGIVFCGSGIGVSVAANKIEGVRAAVGHTVEEVKAARNDDDINVLAVAADFTQSEDAQRVLTAFIETPFSKLERHARRIA